MTANQALPPHELPRDLDPLRARSGFADLVDYRLVRWEADLAEVALQVGAQHLNRSGALHGGVLCTLIDAACGYAGCFLAIPGRRRRAFTLSLNTHFITAVSTGARLLCRARRTGGGRSVFFAAAEVLDEAGRLVARGDGVFKYRGRSGEPEGEPANRAPD
jgi:uncharacterized protein (TIGR00369 family)